jgi:general bacterial porin, GBP family
MKKHLIIAAAVAATFASASYAQSSVTLYGIVDAGFTYTTNIGNERNFAMTSGNVQASRWGLRGVEDLGGGLKTVFNLESGFDVMNGSNAVGGKMFNRQAFVGLSHAQFGTVTFGRQFDSVIDYVGPLMAVGTWGGTYMAHVLDNDNGNGSFSINNSIKFRSANYSGFEFGGLYGFSNQAGGFANNRTYSAGASYQNAGLRVGAAYLQAQGMDRGVSGVTGSVEGSPLSMFDMNHRQRTWGAGASYTFGPVVAGAVFTQTRVNDAMGASMRFNNAEGNVRYNLTPVLGIGAMYTYTNVNGDALNAGGSNSAHWHQFGLQADYALSKRTDVYLEGVGLWGSGANAVGLTQVGYGTDGGGVSSSKNQGIITTGIRHRF